MRLNLRRVYIDKLLKRQTFPGHHISHIQPTVIITKPKLRVKVNMQRVVISRINKQQPLPVLQLEQRKPGAHLKPISNLHVLVNRTLQHFCLFALRSVILVVAVFQVDKGLAFLFKLPCVRGWSENEGGEGGVVVVDAFLVGVDEAASVALAAVELDGGGAGFAVVARVVAFAEFVEFEN